MIYVLHGEDTVSSYNRLQQILKNYESYQKVRLEENTPVEKYFDAVFAQDLLETDKIIICENFISSKKIKVDNLKSTAEAQNVIFLEKKDLSKSIISKLTSGIRIEQFKPPAHIFYFLDSISQNPFVALKKLSALGKQQTNLSWHLANRFQLLILAKLGFSAREAGDVSGKPIQSWQWQKISQQAKAFDDKVLKKLFSGIVKIDYLIKTGKTNLDETYLVSTLLLKYIKG